MPTESFLAPFESDVRAVFKELMSQELVYFDVAPSVQQVPVMGGMQAVPVVQVFAMAPCGDIGNYHVSVMFFGFADMKRMETIRDKVREFRESLANARSEYANQAMSLPDHHARG